MLVEVGTGVVLVVVVVTAVVVRAVVVGVAVVATAVVVRVVVLEVRAGAARDGRLFSYRLKAHAPLLVSMLCQATSSFIDCVPQQQHGTHPQIPPPPGHAVLHDESAILRPPYELSQ